MGLLKKKNIAVSGTAWRFFERICAQLITFVVSVVLARLLSPNEYGMIAIVTVFVTLANVFVSDGLAAALVQKKEVDLLDFSTVLYGGFILSLVLYAFLFFLAPLVGYFYKLPILTPILRVLLLRIPLAAINCVESAYLSRKLEFRKFFFATLGGTLFSGIVGIIMAYNGFGIWALVGQNLTNYTIDVIVLALVIRRIPPLKISIQRMKALYSFGGKILATNLIFQLINQLRTLIIGKKYSADALSFYTKGLYFPNLIGQNISGPLSAVLFPLLSKKQNNIAEIRSFLRKTIRLLSFITAPLLTGLAAVSTPMVSFLLTEKWLPAVPFIWYGAIYHSFTVLHGTNLEAVKAIGAGDQVLHYGNIKRVIGLATLLCTFWISVEAMAIGLIASAVLCTLVNMYQNKKLFAYGYREQLVDFAPNMLAAWFMCIVVYNVGMILPFGNLKTMIVQICLGVFIYWGISLFVSRGTLRYLLTLLKI